MDKILKAADDIIAITSSKDHWLVTERASIVKILKELVEEKFNSTQYTNSVSVSRGTLGAQICPTCHGTGGYAPIIDTTKGFAHGNLNYRSEKMTPEQLAEFFHSTYERLAPVFGWRTKKGCNVPFALLPERNKALMVATCQAALNALQNSGTTAEQITSTQSDKITHSCIECESFYGCIQKPEQTGGCFS